MNTSKIWKRAIPTLPIFGISKVISPSQGQQPFIQHFPIFVSVWFSFDFKASTYFKQVCASEAQSCSLGTPWYNYLSFSHLSTPVRIHGSFYKSLLSSSDHCLRSSHKQHPSKVSQDFPSTSLFCAVPIVNSLVPEVRQQHFRLLRNPAKKKLSFHTRARTGKMPLGNPG